MGHSENRGRRGLTLPLQPRAKLIGLSILIAGLASLITSAQLDPIMAQVERVIDGDTIRFVSRERATPSGSSEWTPRRRSTPPKRCSISDGRQAPSPRPRSKVRRCYSKRTAPEIPWTATGAFELDGAPLESVPPNARFLRRHGDDACGTRSVD